MSPALQLFYAVTLAVYYLRHVAAAGYSTSSTSGVVIYQIVGVVSPPVLNAADANGKNSGFMIDFLEAIKNEGDFDYLLTEQPDGVYGEVYPNGTSTGIVHAVQSGVADIAAAELTATTVTQSVVDFTVPWIESDYRIAVNTDKYSAANLSYLVANNTNLRLALSNSVNPLAQSIWAQVETDPSLHLVTASDETVQKLLAANSPTAFVTETPYLKIVVDAHKDKLSLLPNIIARSYYALAVKLGNNDLRLKLNKKILAVQEKGILENLLEKYFPPSCP